MDTPGMERLHKRKAQHQGHVPNDWAQTETGSEALLCYGGSLRSLVFSNYGSTGSMALAASLFGIRRPLYHLNLYLIGLLAILAIHHHLPPFDFSGRTLPTIRAMQLCHLQTMHSALCFF